MTVLIPFGVTAFIWVLVLIVVYGREIVKLKETIGNQQKQIDELKREVEGMKKTEP